MNAIYKMIAGAATLLGAFATPGMASWSGTYEHSSGTYYATDYVNVPSAAYASIYGSLETNQTDGWMDSATLSINDGPTAYIYGPDFGETYVSGPVSAGSVAINFQSHIGSTNGASYFYVQIDW